MLNEVESMYTAFMRTKSAKKHERFPRCIIDLCHLTECKTQNEIILDSNVIADGCCTLETNMGLEFHGHLLDGKTIGYGELIWEDGAVVKGEVSNNSVSGLAKINWANGDEYVGQVLNNVRNGNGSLTSNHGKSVYKGNWVNGMRNGYGEQVYADNSIYRGMWCNNKRHGHGILLQDNGRVLYDGNWDNDVRQKRGAMIWRRRRQLQEQQEQYEKQQLKEKQKEIEENSEMLESRKSAKEEEEEEEEQYLEAYKGEWEANIPHGQGRCVYARCKANNQEGMMTRTNAQVTEKNSNKLSWSRIEVANVYEGSVMNGCREGSGTFYYADGSLYCGEWHSNKKNGTGIYITSNGDVVGGNFADNTISTKTSCKNMQELSDRCNANLTVNSISSNNNNDIIPKLYINDLCGLCDESTSEMTCNTNLLLFKYTTTLKNVFCKYNNLRLACSEEGRQCNLHESAEEEYEEKSSMHNEIFHSIKNEMSHLMHLSEIESILLDEAFIPGHISLAQIIQLLHDAEIFDGHGCNIVTILKLVEHLFCIERERRLLEMSCEFATLAVHQLNEKIKRITDIYGCNLNYRQFVELLIRLCPIVCTGNKYITLREKFDGLLVKLIPLTNSEHVNFCWLLTRSISNIIKTKDKYESLKELHRFYKKMLSEQGEVITPIKGIRTQILTNPSMQWDDKGRYHFVSVRTMTETFLLNVSVEYHIELSTLYSLIQCITCAKKLEMYNDIILHNNASQQYCQSFDNHCNFANCKDNQVKDNSHALQSRFCLDDASMTMYLDVKVSVNEFVYVIISLFMLCCKADNDQMNLENILLTDNFKRFIMYDIIRAVMEVERKKQQQMFDNKVFTYQNNFCTLSKIFNVNSIRIYSLI